ncbi:hypothetical protein HDV00_008268 [Rhizophlyctis rosea]|nr:hypothetical protein HDV00_008268 [Rhizophlyctis rosea]
MSRPGATSSSAIYDDFDEIPDSFASQLVDLSPKAWFKVIGVVGLGIYIGTLIAIHGSKLLSDYNIFTYVPDDDDDDDDDAEEVAQHIANEHDNMGSMDITNVFGSFRMQVNFDWGNADKDYLNMTKAKLTEQLTELEEAMQLKKPEGIPLQEAELAVQYLKQSIELVDERLAS